MKEISAPDSTNPQEIPSQAEKPLPAKQQPSSRSVASLQLSRQGQILLAKRDPDAAIRMLERAVSLNPSNGQNYYYLSEAWLMKANAEQAKEFNRLAELYLQSDFDWRTRVARQSDRIQELEK